MMEVEEEEEEEEEEKEKDDTTKETKGSSSRMYWLLWTKNKNIWRANERPGRFEENLESSTD